MPITTLLLDAGGTLVFPNFRRIARELEVDGVKVDPAELARAEAAVRFGIDRAEIIAGTDDAHRFRRYLDAVVGIAARTAIPEATLMRLQAYHDEQNLWEEVPPDVLPALEALRGRFRLGVVSNANGTVRAKLDRLGLGSFFEVVVDSREEGVEKPDARLFHIALARMNVRAAETAYVGDLYHVDVVGAVAAGLRPFLLDPLDFHRARPVTRIRALIDLMTAL
jgi:putative hydrolase of the HAD superfamily